MNIDDTHEHCRAELRMAQADAERLKQERDVLERGDNLNAARHLLDERTIERDQAKRDVAHHKNELRLEDERSNTLEAELEIAKGLRHIEDMKLKDLVSAASAGPWFLDHLGLHDAGTWLIAVMATGGNPSTKSDPIATAKLAALAPTLAASNLAMGEVLEKALKDEEARGDCDCYGIGGRLEHMGNPPPCPCDCHDADDWVEVCRVALATRPKEASWKH